MIEKLTSEESGEGVGGAEEGTQKGTSNGYTAPGAHGTEGRLVGWYDLGLCIEGEGRLVGLL